MCEEVVAGCNGEEVVVGCGRVYVTLCGCGCATVRVGADYVVRLCRGGDRFLGLWRRVFGMRLHFSRFVCTSLHFSVFAIVCYVLDFKLE